MRVRVRLSAQFRALGFEREYQIDVDCGRVTLGQAVVLGGRQHVELTRLLGRPRAESNRPFALFVMDGGLVGLDAEVTDNAVIDVFLPVCGG